jgi:hypothetical protein
MKRCLTLVAVLSALIMIGAGAASATISYTGGRDTGDWFIGRGDVLSNFGKAALTPHIDVGSQYQLTRTLTCTYGDGTVVQPAGSLFFGIAYRAEARYAPGSHVITGYAAGSAQILYLWSGSTFEYELVACPGVDPDNPDPAYLAAHGGLVSQTSVITETVSLFIRGRLVYGPALIYGPVTES